MEWRIYSILSETNTKVTYHKQHNNKRDGSQMTHLLNTDEKSPSNYTSIPNFVFKSHIDCHERNITNFKYKSQRKPSHLSHLVVKVK